MAFLLVVYVPYEQDVEREIRELSAATSTEQGEDEDTEDVDAETDQQKCKEPGSSSDSSSDEEADEGTRKDEEKEKGKTEEPSDENSLKDTRDEKQEGQANIQEKEPETNSTDNACEDGDAREKTPEKSDTEAVTAAETASVDKPLEQAEDKTEGETGNEAKEADGGEVTTEETSEDQTADSSKTDNEEDTDLSMSVDKKDLIPLLPALPLYKLVENALVGFEVENWDVAKIGDESTVKFTFVQNDSMRCENILNKLKSLGVGKVARSSISVFPASLHESGEDSVQASPTKEYIPNEELLKKESTFKKSIKSRLVVDQVVASVRSNATFTFDYLLLLILASLIACLGLVENSSVILVASMLISPLMGPILAGTFGQVIKRRELRNIGVKSEVAGLCLCLIVGFIFGLIAGGIGLNGAVWGSTDSWPTAEMKSRGMVRSLWVGILIALPSGAGVAISVLGGNAGSLVGVAISASLLPPACNAGVLWAYSLLAAISPPGVVDNISMSTATSAPVTVTTTMSTNITSVTNSTTSIPTTTLKTMLVPEDCFPLVNNAYRQVYSCNVATDAALLGLVSLCLTILNITCILIMGIIVLKIKEVAPVKGSKSSVDHFWHEDVKVARTYYQTSKGEESDSLGRQFLDEWKKIKEQEKKDQHAMEEEGEESEDEEGETDSIAGQMETINFFNYLSDVENSPGIQHVLSKLSPATPPEPVTVGLSGVYNRAAMDLELKLSQRPSVYLMEPTVKDKLVSNAYHTIHGSTNNEDKKHKPTLAELRKRLSRSTQSAYFDSPALEMINEVDSGPKEFKSRVGLVHPSSSGLWNRRKKKKTVKFHVTKVEEETLLP